MSEDLQTLEQKIDRLINICARLQKENLSLRERESTLLRERSKLLEKNELARNRVEHMIVRLKNLNNEG
ncbi:TIGR02449 family protein [Porticoccus sp.]|mgnify:FL=1|uniref:TIGR02449 family protein n=1 Tax=Porticoccus sp. TaxID=2024853 RepID=UPI003F69B61C